jgi:hypothetical protein
MNQSFEVDRSFRSTAMYAGKQLLLVVFFVAFNFAIGLPPSVSIGVAVVGVTLTTLSVVLRRPGGDKVTITSESLILSMENVEKKTISLQLISAVRIQKDTMVVAWRETGHRPKSVIFARENFSESTWQQLSAAVATLRDRAPTAPSKPREFRL